MSKTIYSLVLSDDVVAEIDRLAYRNNTNRSNMINQILAEYVSYVTPEKRMRDTFRRMEAMFSGQDDIRLLLQPSETLMTLRSALAYKYNPTVRYAVELYRGGDALGELRVSLRTQNQALLFYMTEFYRLWMAAEGALIGECAYHVEDGKFCRKLVPRSQDGGEHGLSSEALGDLICAYIEVFDRALKFYFDHLETPQTVADQISALYRAYAAAQNILI